MQSNFYNENKQELQKLTDSNFKEYIKKTSISILAQIQAHSMNHNFCLFSKTFNGLNQSLKFSRVSRTHGNPAQLFVYQLL